MNAEKHKKLRIIVPLFVGLLLQGFFFLIKDYTGNVYPWTYLISAYFGLLIFFAFEWIEFKGLFNAFQVDFNNKIRTLNNITSLMEDFVEANIIIDNLISSVRPDLEFNKRIKSSKEGCELDFHLYLSKLKYENYFKSHFIFDANNKSIKKIPKKYFEDPIWARLVGDSKYYLSAQIIAYDTKDLYLSDSNRRDLEIARITAKIKQGELLVFNKLFIIEDSLIDMDTNQILDNTLFQYLHCWMSGFIISSDIQLKIIKFSRANGAIGPEKVKDMGIFDKILAFQTIDKNDELVSQAHHSGIARERAFTFEFNLDSSVTQEYTKDFNTIFKQADDLSSYSFAVIP